MNLFFDTELGKQQNKATHKIRVMSEAWLEKNGYCPCCGSKPMKRFANNKPVADLFCPNCHEQYELKSKNQKTIGNSVPDGAYRTMLERIRSDTNPNFFFLAYKKADYSIRQLVLVPKHFITPDMIIPRNKGIKNRPHHIMCSINLAPLPESGKIFLNRQFPHYRTRNRSEKMAIQSVFTQPKCGAQRLAFGCYEMYRPTSRRIHIVANV